MFFMAAGHNSPYLIGSKLLSWAGNDKDFGWCKVITVNRVFITTVTINTVLQNTAHIFMILFTTMCFFMQHTN